MNLPDPVVVLGLGELGGVFSRGLLRRGHPVVPILRNTSLDDVHARYPEPLLVLVAVGEDDLPPALESLPDSWRTRVGLVQNELLPGAWEASSVVDPTVAVVWFEKKPGREVHDVLPTVIAGPHQDTLASALRDLQIPHRAVAPSELLHELVAKNLYILVLNLAGLDARGTAGDLLTVHRKLFDTLTGEVIELQRALVGPVEARKLDPARLMDSLETAIASDPGHGMAGRSAPRRLERNLVLARQLGLVLPTFERLGQTHLASSGT